VRDHLKRERDTLIAMLDRLGETQGRLTEAQCPPITRALYALDRRSGSDESIVQSVSDAREACTGIGEESLPSLLR
jgi:hypothetical protein